MKKRIISMLLVLVMLSLSLIGCGYSMAEDDLSKYATFENKAAFEEALKNLVIEDGDFTLDSATRHKKVMETIYAAFASNAKAEDAKTAGVPGAHDLVKYCYYMTVDIDGVTRYFSTSTMNTSSAVQLQIGADYSDSSAGAKVVEQLSKLDFTNKTYTVVSSTDKTKVGDVAFVSYKYSYTVNENGAEVEKTGTITYDRIPIEAAAAEGADPTSLASYLCAQTIGVTLADKTITEEGKGSVKYSNIKINWIGKGEEIVFKDTTYKQETKLKDVKEAKEFDLNDREITYHIYPVSYTPVKDYTPENVIELFGANLTVDNLYAYILGSKYAGLDKDDEDDKATLEERVELLKNYKAADGKTLEDLATALAKIFDTINNATTGTLAAFNKADTAYNGESGAIKTLEKAEKALADENAKETPDATKVAELTAAVEKAKTAKETAKKAFEDAEKLHNSKVDEKNALIKSLFEITVDNETVETKIERGYRVVIYENLQEYDSENLKNGYDYSQAPTYNYEIKMNLAKEIYYYLVTNSKTCVNVSGVPEEAVEMTYKQLMENYEYDFYEQTSDETGDSDYKANEGSFKKFLIKEMKDDHPTVKTYEDAKKAVWEDAAEYVKPLVAIYYAAEVYGLALTEKEIDEYKDSEEYIAASGYGENTAIHAYQFDKLMNYFLEYEEVTEADGEYTKVIHKYKAEKIAYTFGTPASESEEEETTEEE